MTDKQLRDYARILLHLGVDLQKGQNITVRGEICHNYFLEIIMEEAYKAGARYVRIDNLIPSMQKMRANFSNPEYLEYVPGYLVHQAEDFLSEGWANLYVGGQNDPEYMATANLNHLTKINQAMGNALQFYQRALLASSNAWNVSVMPTPKWAAKVLGCAADQTAADKLWDILVPILKLDATDPIDAWRKHAAKIKTRRMKLDEMHLDYVHFEGPGTDLKVHLNPASCWEGGSEAMQDGRTFFANIPTEEVFTTPNYLKTEGRVQCTRPVTVFECGVEEAWFEFHEGKLINCGAKTHADVLQKFVEADTGNRFLGELALVDSSSAIFQSGKVFHNILLDENAACHIALGRGYAGALQGGNTLDDKALRAAGCNISNFHLDFMIGSPEVTVHGFKDGKRLPILNKGSFVI